MPSLHWTAVWPAPRVRPPWRRFSPCSRSPAGGVHWFPLHEGRDRLSAPVRSLAVVTGEIPLLKIWIVGARGAIASTLTVGLLAARRGLIPLEGLLTETPPFRALGLASLEDVEIGGCDLIPGTLADSAHEALQGVGCFPVALIDAVMPALERITITRGILRGGGPAVDALARDQRVASAAGNARDALSRILADLERFANGAPTVVVNLASTEPPPAAPLVLDIARLLLLAQHRDEAGPIAALGLFFKSPEGSTEMNLHHQYDTLLRWTGASTSRTG